MLLFAFCRLFRISDSAGRPDQPNGREKQTLTIVVASAEGVKCY